MRRRSKGHRKLRAWPADAVRGGGGDAGGKEVATAWRGLAAMVVVHGGGEQLMPTSMVVRSSMGGSGGQVNAMAWPGDSASAMAAAW